MTDKRASGGRKLSDPLVPISGRHLRALLRAAGLSEREAVKALRRRGVRTAQATLDHIIWGRQSRCRASLRDGLAGLLGALLPPEWLDGEHDSEMWGDGPDLNGRDRHGATEKVIAQERRRRHLPQPKSIGPDPSGPPLYELVAYQLKKDLEALNVPDLSVPDLVRVLSLSMWRRWFASGGPTELIELGEMDRFAELMSEAMRIALRPSLDGESSIPSPRLKQFERAMLKVRSDTLGAERARSEELLRMHEKAQTARRG